VEAWKEKTGYVAYEKVVQQTPVFYADCDECGKFHVRRASMTWQSFVQAGGVLRCYACAKLRKKAKKIEAERARRALWRENNDPRYEILKARESNKVHRRRVRITATSDVSNSFLRKLRLSRKTCPLCGVRFSEGNRASVDHVIPLALGGTHTRDNLRLCCCSCNSRRGATLSDVSNFQLNLGMCVDAS
jgi:5-methylcytosine-specific restriction endonuclease McrA